MVLVSVNFNFLKWILIKGPVVVSTELGTNVHPFFIRIPFKKNNLLKLRLSETFSGTKITKNKKIERGGRRSVAAHYLRYIIHDNGPSFDWVRYQLFYIKKSEKSVNQ